jgi:hypothetical protein
MSKTLTPADIVAAGKKYNVEPAAIAAVRQVESGGPGFHPVTGKLIIQFEPRWFERFFNGYTVPNEVSNQAIEWAAFNKAWQIPGLDKASKRTAQTAAMMATSIGAFQIMGFHFARLGFKTVGAFWDYCKISEANQLDCLMRFIASDTPYIFAKAYGGDGKRYTLASALAAKNFNAFAYRYNGALWQGNDYGRKMSRAHTSFSAQPIYYV